MGQLRFPLSKQFSILPLSTSSVSAQKNGAEIGPYYGEEKTWTLRSLHAAPTLSCNGITMNARVTYSLLSCALHEHASQCLTTPESIQSQSWSSLPTPPGQQRHTNQFKIFLLSASHELVTELVQTPLDLHSFVPCTCVFHTPRRLNG